MFINQSPFLREVSYDFVSATAPTVLNGFPTRPTIRAEGVSLFLGLAGVGGVGLVVAVVYELATANPGEFSVGRMSVGVVVVAAVLTLIGAGLQLAA